MSLSGVGIQTLKDVNSLQLILGRLNWLNVEYRLKKHWRLPCFSLRRLDLRGLFSIEHSFLWWFPLDVFFSSKQNLKKTQFRYKRICHLFLLLWGFLFGRFDPNHYYFVLILNTRNLLIGTIPVPWQPWMWMDWWFFGDKVFHPI